jgi:nitrogen fixation protein
VRALLWLLVLVAACDKQPPKAGAGTGSALPPVGDLPDTLTYDWQNMSYDLGALGTVHAVGGVAKFPAGYLAVDAPVFVDLDGDHHEEAVIPFELSSGNAVWGAFVFTLRNGLPLQLGTIPTKSRVPFTVEGATIRTGEGEVWRWDATAHRLVR